MSEAELFNEAAQPASLLDRVEIGALQVLDKAEHELRVIACVAAYNRGHGGEPREPRGSPPAFAGDELVPVRERPHEQRLQDSMLAYRLGQLAERLRIETRPYLLARGADLVDGDHLRHERLPFAGHGDQCVEAAAESAWS